MSETDAVFALYGVGQLGRLFGAGLLARGHAVHPLRRATPSADRDALLARADRVLVAVGEDDLSPVLASLPARLREGRTWLLQNELSPSSWESAEVRDPTVLIVWSEKKRGRSISVVDTTLVAGPDRALAVEALGEVDVPSRAIEDEALVDALIDKNLYILVSNLAGLWAQLEGRASGATVGGLLTEHRETTTAIALEVLAVEGARVGRVLAPTTYLARLWAAFSKDPSHASRGRTAEARLGRTLARADALGVATPQLRYLSK